MEIKNKEDLKNKIGEMKSTGICCNVGIFVDFDNIYYGFRDYGIEFNIEREYDLFSLMNELYGMDCIRTMRAYADFDQVDVTLRLLQENRVQIRNVYGNGQNEHSRKNASDIELSIDAVESYYSNKDIDTYVFVTADSDMIPVMSRMIYKGKKVHLFYIGSNLSTHQDMKNYCHLHSDLIEVFNIDKARREAPYYKDSAMSVIKNWFEKSYNKGKTLGGKWLSEELQKNLHVSIKLSSEIIEYLKSENLIVEQAKQATKYYVVKDASSVCEKEDEDKDKENHGSEKGLSKESK